MNAELKPQWHDAPEWANSLGVISVSEYKGQWCWFSGTSPSGVRYVEERPRE
jgi:hypothetical protein